MNATKAANAWNFIQNMPKARYLPARPVFCMPLWGLRMRDTVGSPISRDCRD